jgi:hypothetical protein
MADIEGLLFGGDLGEPDMPFAAEGAHTDRVAQARDWCQTPPDDAAIQWLAATLGTRRRLGKAARGESA